MKKLKVVTIVGTRPEIIRLSRLIPKLNDHTEHVLVHTGQNPHAGLSDDFFHELRIPEPQHRLEVRTDSLGMVLGDTLQRIEPILRDERPDAVMILGDTNSAIAAVMAERLGIPVYHMEAGNRSFDNNVPEELNRKLVDHISSFNLAYNTYSMRNLLAEGIHPRFIQVTGSPMREVLAHYRSDIEASSVLDRLGLEAGGYLLVSTHRQENLSDRANFSTLLQSLSEIGTERQLRVLISTHPRTRQILGLAEGLPSNLEFHEPFGFFDYIRLQMKALCVLSDSGTISEESSILEFPAISIRQSIERPEALESGAIALSEFHKESLSAAIDYRLGLTRSAVSLPEGYEVDDFSTRVLSFLLSTAPIVSIWKGTRKQNK